jgi:hypothetical protein
MKQHQQRKIGNRRDRKSLLHCLLLGEPSGDAQQQQQRYSLCVHGSKMERVSMRKYQQPMQQRRPRNTQDHTRGNNNNSTNTNSKRTGNKKVLHHCAWCHRGPLSTATAERTIVANKGPLSRTNKQKSKSSPTTFRK